MNKTIVAPVQFHLQSEAIPSFVIHPGVSAKASELLLKTADMIANRPDRYNQAKCNPMATLHCGSPVCIVGQMMFFESIYISQPGGAQRMEIAPKLGLTARQMEDLFWIGRWPIHSRPSLWRRLLGRPMDPASITPRQGIDRIEYMLATGR